MISKTTDKKECNGVFYVTFLDDGTCYVWEPIWVSKSSCAETVIPIIKDTLEQSSKGERMSIAANIRGRCCYLGLYGYDDQDLSCFSYCLTKDGISSSQKCKDFESVYSAHLATIEKLLVYCNGDGI